MLIPAMLKTFLKILGLAVCRSGDRELSLLILTHIVLFSYSLCARVQPNFRSAKLAVGLSANIAYLSFFFLFFLNVSARITVPVQKMPKPLANLSYPNR